MNTVNFMKQIIIALQKTYATLMMNIIRFYKQAKRYEKDNIKNNFSYSLSGSITYCSIPNNLYLNISNLV